MIKISAKEQCCGCSACLHICPKHCIIFREDKEGFLYPKVDESSCIDCGLCEKVCPVINQDEERTPLKVYAAKHPDENVRLKSSSGGVFTFLAEQVIDEGGVVFGARFNEKWEVIHDYAETKEELAPFRGSKYVQSFIGDSYKQVETFLKAGRKVMFTGTPCQIAGLKKYLRREYDNLLTVDFVCHGVPSPKVWRMYLQEEIARQGDTGKNTVLTSSKVTPVLIGVNFRDKSTGWEKFSFVLNFSKASAEGEQNSVLSSVFSKNAYMKAFLTNLSLRPSCYACPAKSGKSGSDITIGDFWGEENVIRQNDNIGISLVMIQNSQIEEVIIKDSILSRVDYNESIKYNSSYHSSIIKPVNRDFFFNFLNKKNFYRCYSMIDNDSIFAKVRRVIYRKIGI